MNMKKFGIYALVFHTDKGQRVYIGSTITSFERRKRQHFSELIRGKHKNPRIQNYYYHYGFPEFQIVEICDNPDIEALILCEQSWIERVDPSLLINLGPAFPSPTFGMKYSPEIREKISRAARGRPGNKGMLGKFHSQETKEKMSLMRKGKKRKPHSEETKEKLSQIKRGKKSGPHSLETRKKISKSNTGKSMSPKAREALLRSHLGKPQLPKTREKISKAMLGNQHLLGHHPTEETRNRISNAIKNSEKFKLAMVAKRDKPGKPHSEETKRKISTALKEAWVKKKTEDNDA